MPKTKISEWSSTPANNTDIDSINIAEGCAPSGINDALREMMSQVKDLYAGTSGDIIAVAAGGTGVGTSTGSGSNVLSTSPTLVTPALGTPSALVGTNITGTAANFNINGTVGATTANTGAFTTLAASSTVTLSGGTANGVTYLNGSKVLTSGSALTFDGTTLLQDASGASAQANFRVQTNTAGAVANGYFNINGTDYFRIYTTSSETGLRNLQNTPMYFSVNNTEGMRLTSTGLGIGTSVPVAKLDVYQATAGTAALKILHVNGNGIVVNPSYNYYDAYSHYFRSLSGTTTYATIDNSGNVGIGTSSPTQKLDIATASGDCIIRLGNGTSQARLAVDSDGPYIYALTSGDNALRVFTSVGSQAMTLDSGGDLYLPKYFYIGNASNTASQISSGSGSANLCFGINGTEKARIDTSGNLLVGGTATTGSASNSKIVAGGIFKTVSGSVSTSSGVATTLFTAPSTLGAYLVTVNLDADSTGYAATYMINTQGNSATVATLIYKGAYISVSVSGYNVQATQTSGAAGTIQYSAVRIF